MAISERERLKSYEKLGETLGPELAGTMMELLPPTGWDDIATKDEVRSLGSALRGEMGELRGEMKEFRAEVRNEIAHLEVGVAQQLVSLQRNMLLTMSGFMLSIWITLLLT